MDGKRHKVTEPIKGRFIGLVMRAKAFSNRSAMEKKRKKKKAIEMTAAPTLTINLAGDSAAASAPPSLINDVQTHVWVGARACHEILPPDVITSV